MFPDITIFPDWLDDEADAIEKRNILNLLIINGSPRTYGATGKILTYIGKKLCELNPQLEITHVNLGDYNLKLCVGCMACYKTGDCIIQDDGVENLCRLIEQCDGVVFGTPTYASNVSGHFKILIDRGHFVFEQLLSNKACFSVVTYENAGGNKSQNIVNELIHFSGGSVCGQYRKKLNHGSEPLDKATQKSIDKECVRYLRRAKRKTPLSISERVMRAIVFNLGLRGHALKNPTRYKAVISIWKNKGYI